MGVIGIVQEALSLARTTLEALGTQARHRVHDARVVDITTVGDRAVSDSLLRFFRESGVPAVLLSEESGRTDLAAHPEYTVVFDDIDGTDNYHRGEGALPYCTVIAILNGAKPRFRDAVAAGIIEHRTRNTWTAERGAGAFLNGTQVHVSKRSLLDRQTLVVVDHYAAAADVVRLEALYPAAWVKDFGSAALHLAGVSSGMFDAYVNPRQKSHEIVAGYLLINEAGGVVSDFSGNAIDGRPFEFDATYDLIAAANNSISESIRVLIRR